MSEWGKMDYVLAYDQRKLVVVKRPGEAFLIPPDVMGEPEVRVEVNASELTAGKDTLILRVDGLEADAVDLLYTLDGHAMPPVTNWRLDAGRSLRVFVDHSTPRGVYHLIGIRDSRDEKLNQWIAIDASIRVNRISPERVPGGKSLLSHEDNLS